MEDNVPPPKPIIRERLIDDFYEPRVDTHLNADLEDILALSAKEYDEFQENQEQMEYELILEREKRQNKFNQLKKKVKKIMSFDKANAEYYELTLNCIDMFEEAKIDRYILTKDKYNEWIRVFNTIRCNKEEFEHLKQVIIFESE